MYSAEDLFPGVVAVEEKKDDAMGPPPALGQQEAQSPGRASEDEGQAEPSPSPAGGKECLMMHVRGVVRWA